MTWHRLRTVHINQWRRTKAVGLRLHAGLQPDDHRCFLATTAPPSNHTGVVAPGWQSGLSSEIKKLLWSPRDVPTDRLSLNSIIREMRPFKSARHKTRYPHQKVIALQRGREYLLRLPTHLIAFGYGTHRASCDDSIVVTYVKICS